MIKLLVIDKKRIKKIVIAIILGFSVFFIGKEPNYIIPVSSLPIAEHTIVLDAGHGQPDGRSY